MPELRKDPIIGRWVIIATERAKRPDQFSAPASGPAEGECPFCRGHEDHTPKQILTLPESVPGRKVQDWQVRVIPSIKPVLKIEGGLERSGHGIYDTMNGIGAHEIVVETPEHINNIADLSLEQVDNVLNIYRHRIEDLGKDRRFRYVLVFKNFGWAAGGGRIKHSRSQIIATPVTPKRVKEKLAGSKRYFDYRERCIFCDLIKQELESGDRLIIEVDGFIAVSPFASRFPFEVWILPKKHSCDFVKLDDSSRRALAKILKIVLSKLKKGLNDPPFNYIIHTAPFRRPKSGYWRTIEEDYHWHIEIMPRLTRVAGFEWGTGFYICPLPPESAAKFLREVQVENG
ncbi:galactose-1-phosphate uridylyltransferase [Candidatus Omnitrophota bacterium]